MTEENVQDTAQENPSNAVENKPESPSNDGLLSEVMAKKEKIKTLEAELAKRDASDEKRRVTKLEEDGKLKELLAEIKSENESLKPIAGRYKQTLVNGLTSDDERKEYLSTKSVDFLEELTKEKAAMAPPPVDNPQESLGSVRKVVSNKPYASMNEAERQEWHESQTAHLRK